MLHCDGSVRWSQCKHILVFLAAKATATTEINRPRGYKTFFMLNSVEHEILNAHKYKSIKKFGLFKGSSQHQVGGEWFEIELGKISRMLVKYEVLPIPNVISVC